jgi:hypothetical protein
MRIKVALIAALLLVAASAADARITKLKIVEKQSPTFGGYAFRASGSMKSSSARRTASSIPTIRRTLRSSTSNSRRETHAGKSSTHSTSTS